MAFGAAVCVTAYLAATEGAENDRAAVEGIPVPPPAIRTGTPASTIDSLPAKPKEAEHGEPAHGEDGRNTWVPPPELAMRPTPPRQSAVRGAAAAARAAPPHAEAGAAGAPDALPGSSARPVRASSAGAPAAAAVPVVPTPEPAADRWQAMTIAIERCAREDFLASVVCDQRTRLQYCDGHWGAVPQCPAGNRADQAR